MSGRVEENLPDPATGSGDRRDRAHSVDGPQQGIASGWGQRGQIAVAEPAQRLQRQSRVEFIAVEGPGAAKSISQIKTM